MNWGKAAVPDKNLKTTKFLVTGGAGYIGSHTVYALLEAGAEVAVIDNLSTGFRQAVHPDVRFWQGDLLDREFLAKVFQKERPHIVIHFASSSQVAESMREPLAYYKNNVEGTRVLLELVMDHGPGSLVFSSSAAVYGEPDRLPIEEDTALQPTSVYGETKKVMEDLMGWCSRAGGLRYVALRYFNACGAHPNGRIGEAHQPESHLIPLVFQAASGQRPFVNIYGTDYPTRDGSCVRDYIHVMDLAEAHILAARYLLAGGTSDVLNLGSDEGYTVNEVIAKARQVTGEVIETKETSPRAGDPARLVASSRKARRLLGWEPQMSDLQTILTTAWNWHRTHPQGYVEE